MNKQMNACIHDAELTELKVRYPLFVSWPISSIHLADVPYLSSKAFVVLESFFTLRNSRSTKSKVEGMSFKVKPESPNGVIFYNGASNGAADFMSLAMRDGKLEYR